MFHICYMLPKQLSIALQQHLWPPQQDLHQQSMTALQSSPCLYDAWIPASATVSCETTVAEQQLADTVRAT